MGKKIIILYVLALLLLPPYISCIQRYVTISGVVEILGDPSESTGQIRVEARAGSETGSIVEYVILSEPGPYALQVRAGIGEVYVIALLDADNSGTFGDPCDTSQSYTDNPIEVGYSDIYDVDILIPGWVMVNASGIVDFQTIIKRADGDEFSDEYEFGEILVSAYQIGELEETLIAETTLSEPGAYTLTLPLCEGDVAFYASVDINKDGTFDDVVDLNAEYEENPVYILGEDLFDVDFYFEYIYVEISGDITAVQISDDGVYPIEDPADWHYGKVFVTVRSEENGGDYYGYLTFDAVPAKYSLLVPANVGAGYAVAMADMNADSIIAVYDLMREYYANPIEILEDALTDIDILLDIDVNIYGWDWHGVGGGPGCSDVIEISGTVEVEDYNGGNVLVAIYDTTYYGPYWGIILDSPGDFSGLFSCANMGEMLIIGVYDRNQNNLFEPTDHTGGADGNPYTFGSNDISGVYIYIPSAGEGLPEPIPYYNVVGEITYNGDEEEGPDTQVIVFAQRDLEGAGMTIFYGEVMIDGFPPIDYILRLPGNIKDTYVHAGIDLDGSGVVEDNEPFGFYANNPITISYSDLYDVNIEIFDRD